MADEMVIECKPIACIKFPVAIPMPVAGAAHERTVPLLKRFLTHPKPKPARYDVTPASLRRRRHPIAKGRSRSRSVAFGPTQFHATKASPMAAAP